MAIPYVIADLLVFAKIYKFWGQHSFGVEKSIDAFVQSCLFLIVLFLDLDSIALS